MLKFTCVLVQTSVPKDIFVGLGSIDVLCFCESESGGSRVHEDVCYMQIIHHPACVCTRGGVCSWTCCLLSTKINLSSLKVRTFLEVELRQDFWVGFRTGFRWVSVRVSLGGLS